MAPELSRGPHVTLDCREKAFLRPGALTSPALEDRMMVLIFLFTAKPGWTAILEIIIIIIIFRGCWSGSYKPRVGRSYVVASGGAELRDI